MVWGGETKVANKVNFVLLFTLLHGLVWCHIYKGVQEYTRVYKGIQGCTRV